MLADRLCALVPQPNVLQAPTMAVSAKSLALGTCKLWTTASVRPPSVTLILKCIGTNLVLCGLKLLPPPDCDGNKEDARPDEVDPEHTTPAPLAGEHVEPPGNSASLQIVPPPLLHEPSALEPPCCVQRTLENCPAVPAEYTISTMFCASPARE